MSHFWLRLGLALVVYGIDYASKAYTHFFIQPLQYASSTYPFGGIPVFKDFFGIDFCINHAANLGAAWSLFSNLPHLLVIVRLMIICGLLSYMIFSKKTRPYLSPLTLIVAGAVGNITDYFLYGHVVDMFHFILWGYDYPVFNIADSAIFCGVAWIFIRSWRMQPKKRVDCTL